MSVSYKAVGWNKFKYRYDRVMLLAVALFVALFVGISMALFPNASAEIMLLRAFGIGSYLLLHFILIIGPMARLDKRWLPILFNRRHLGVTMFLMALLHAALVILMYHSGGTTNPITSIFITDAGFKQKDLDTELPASPEDDGYVKVCSVDEIPQDAAKGVVISGERVAVVKYEGKISAVSGVCQHQNGPLAEGKFVFGCLTCPWHGYQYKCDTGKSPDPFTEEIPTFNVRLHEGDVYIHPKPNPSGTYAEPAALV